MPTRDGNILRPDEGGADRPLIDYLIERRRLATCPVCGQLVLVDQDAHPGSFLPHRHGDRACPPMRLELKA